VTKSPLPTLLQLDARLREQALEMTSLQVAFDIQLQRIAHMQAELDSLPQARKRRELSQRAFAIPRPSQNGNGHSHG
jgi:hypothetical protein